MSDETGNRGRSGSRGRDRGSRSHNHRGHGCNDAPAETENHTDARGDDVRSDDIPGGDTRADTDSEVLRLSVPKMDCPSCAGKVENSLDGLDGLHSVEPRPTTGTLVVRYDADTTDVASIRKRIEDTGYAVDGGEAEAFSVPEMDCPSCAGKVENALADLDGVIDFETQPTAGRVSVTYDTASASRGSVVAAIEGAGYEVEEGEDGEPDSPHSVWLSSRAIKTWTGAVLLFVGLVFEYLLTGLNATLFTVGPRDVTVDWILFFGAVLVAGQAIVRNGYYSAKNLSLDIDFLMSAGIVGALLVDLPFEAATLAVLFSTAELLERFSMDRARDSMRELMELSPDTATVLRDGEERTLAVEDVAVGDTVVVRPGEKIPLDGVVREGNSPVDESPITGESVPADKTVEDEVYAGSIVESGYLEVEATAPSSESTLSRVIELVEDAQSNRTESEQFIDRFARYYTPVIVVGAVATFLLLPTFFGVPWRGAFVRALTLLVVACPCAFVISTPVSVVSGVTSAARNGVLIKGGNHLEAMGGVDAVAFDKTGTLTAGNLSVTDVIPLNETSESDLLGCARAIEQRSEHPIAMAIIERSENHGVSPRGISNFEAITGKGVKADLDGQTHYAGKPGLFADLGFDLEHAHVKTDGGAVVDSSDGTADAADPRNCEHGSYLDLVNETIPHLQAEGKSVILVGTEDELEGIVAIADTVRPKAKWAVSRLRELGVERVVMLTGDNERTARAIARQVGIDDVRADLLPEEKVEAVDDLRERYENVAMVGDGVNDAPALATATVGIAMGAAGTDTALETADIALMADDLTRLPYLYDLATRSNGVIRQNVWASLAVKAVLAIGAPLGYVPVVAAIVVGDMGMSLGVTGNAMRLAGISPESDGGDDGHSHE